MTRFIVYVFHFRLTICYYTNVIFFNTDPNLGNQRNTTSQKGREDETRRTKNLEENQDEDQDVEMSGKSSREDSIRVRQSFLSVIFLKQLAMNTFYIE